MRPEFLNRIDEIVLFRRLDAEQLRDIARCCWTRPPPAARPGHRVELTDAAVDWIAEPATSRSTGPARCAGSSSARSTTASLSCW